MRRLPSIQGEGTERKHHTCEQASETGWCMCSSRCHHWSYRTEAAITRFNGILGGVDEALDLFDVVGTKEPNVKITSDFLKYLWILYGTEYRTVLACVRIDR